MHPNIVQLSEVFLTADHLAIVSQFAPGGDLVDYIERHNMTHDRALKESEARWLFQQLIVAVDYCHQVIQEHPYCHSSAWVAAYFPASVPWTVV